VTPETIAEAVWENVTRTLASGTPDPPSDLAEEYAEAVWEYVTRTLTDAPPASTRRRNRRRMTAG